MIFLKLKLKPTMETRLYLNLIPESLVASMLPPEEFGNYMAVGVKNRSRGQAIFFEVDPDFTSDHFPLDEIAKRCVPHRDGRPKRSVYLSVYRVLEHVPLSALGQLFLATEDGRVLGLEARPFQPERQEELHLYQEYCPVSVRVASQLQPLDFCRFITRRAQPVSVPKIVFSELVLHDLRLDPGCPEAGDLPYKNIGHLRDCLRELGDGGEKKTKTVERRGCSGLPYRTLRNGFFAGDGERTLHYPLPGRDKLEREHYEWWRSAQSSLGE